MTGERAKTLFWRRCDTAGLERLTVLRSPAGTTITSTILCAGDGAFRLDHRWELDAGGAATALDLDRWAEDGHRTLSLRRAEGGWLVDGRARPDLAGAEEPDLSATPLCNTFAIRRVPERPGASATFDVCYVDAASLTVARSRQRYDRLGPRRLRYVDLGLHAGFEADLEVDEDGFVLTYEGLFARVDA